jgi:uncharacterized protein (TIGR03435 family)
LTSHGPDRTFEKAGQFAQATADHSGSALPEASVPAGVPNIFTAIRETLGLRLEPRREQVETVVIDHIERVPAEN